jgi:5'-3' exonuclease
MSRHIFLLVDAHALIYRAYFALPNLTDPQGHLVMLLMALLGCF